jgi:hypothetical protein
MGAACRLFGLVLMLAVTPVAAELAIDALIAAYPDFVAGAEGNFLIWEDGTRMSISDGRHHKDFRQSLSTPDIKNQFAFRCPFGSKFKPPGLNEDPGPIHYQPFFLKRYAAAKAKSHFASEGCPLAAETRRRRIHDSNGERHCRPAASGLT